MIGQINYSTNWSWLALELDLGRLYRRLFLRTFGIKLQRPSNGEHITLTSVYERQSISPWKLREYDFLSFTLGSVLWTNGNAFWLDVLSENIIEFRTSLGLGEPLISIHFCFGYRNEEKICLL